ncbi:hypothetical protein [Paenibacillus amylolyticus]|uniref:Uncharacterized protein n=1 Tax=Paenibacillus amylolyticus TaxID=1451 RepID=A0ABD8B216_PAEAM
MENGADVTLNQLNIFKQFMFLSYSDTCDAYIALDRHEGDSKYSVALGYLAMSQQSQMELIKLQLSIKIDHQEIEKYMTAYADYTIQLKYVITYKDNNTSTLNMTHSSLIKAGNLLMHSFKNGRIFWHRVFSTHRVLFSFSFL